MLRWISHTFILSLCFFINTSLATTATSTFQITAFVDAACTISSTTLAFSPPSYASASNLNATSTLTVNCTNLAPYSIAMGAGNNASGGVNRMLMGTTNFLNYTLYQDSARTIAWTGSSGIPETGVGTGANQTITVYGQIPSGQSGPPTGAYTDSVVATITY